MSGSLINYIYNNEKETPGTRTYKKHRVTYEDSCKGYNVILYTSDFSGSNTSVSRG